MMRIRNDYSDNIIRYLNELGFTTGNSIQVSIYLNDVFYFSIYLPFSHWDEIIEINTNNKLLYCKTIENFYIELNKIPIIRKQLRKKKITFLLQQK